MTIELTFLGGCGFRLRTAHTCLLIDPYWGGAPREGIDRRQPPPFPAHHLFDAHFVLSTHAHLDHCDPALLKLLHDHSEAQFLGPPSSVAVMTTAGLAPQRIVTVNAAETLSFGEFDGYADKGNDPLEPQAVTFHLTHGDTTIFHSGDSLYADLYKRTGDNQKVDVALLNFGDQLYMSAEDVLQAARDLNCRVCIPMHWDLWEQFYRSPEELATGSDTSFTIWPLNPGETLLVLKDSNKKLGIMPQ